VKRALTAGLFLVITCLVAGTVWMIGSMLTNGVAGVRSFESHCSKSSDVVFPLGSCARSFTSEDFDAGRAELTLVIVRTDSGTRLIQYTYQNLTSRFRSLDWSLITMTTPTGAHLDCPGDVTTQRYPAPPSAPQESEYACAQIDASGRYTASYDGAVVAHLDIDE
jgi:hypothetical protein